MAIRSRLAVGATAVVVVLGACTSGASGPSPTSSPIGSPSGRASQPLQSPGSPELEASGWLLAGAPPGGSWEAEDSSEWPGSTAWQMVADGGGRVWIAGPWQLTRLDLESGESSTWDAADDDRFAWSDVILAATAGPGVWILDGCRVRLFDGEQFTVDLTVPVEVRGSEPYVHDIVEVGSELWLSLADSGGGGQVLRWADGQWTAMSQPGDGVGGYLSVDTQGGIWSGGWSWSGVRRWDGSFWVVPGAGQADAPTVSGDVVADPTGGVWMVSYPGEPQGADVRWWDGSAWHPVARVPGWQPGSGALAVAGSGDGWVASPSGLARVTHDGTKEAFAPPNGADPLVGLTLASDMVAVLGDDGRVSRLDGEQWDEVGVIPTSEPLPIEDPSSTLARAMSADEVWVAAGGMWYRYRDDKWSELGPGTERAIAATDGAWWGWEVVGGSEKHDLVRLTADGFQVVSSEIPPAGDYQKPLRPGRKGSMWWVGEDGDVVEFRADGTRNSIGRPQGMDLVCLGGVGLDGSVWVSSGEDGPQGVECWVDADWNRWNGRRWIPADSPDPFATGGDTVVADDGTGWAISYSGTGSGYEILRYREGRRTTFASADGVTARHLTAVHGGRACVVEIPIYDDTVDPTHPGSTVCYGEGGEFARFDLPDTRLQGVAVAPDGAVWVLGPQVARLTADLSERVEPSAPAGPSEPTTPIRTFEPSTSPLVGATAVAAGTSHSCAIVTDGRVECWGGISGVVVFGPRAVTVPALSGVTALAAGGVHACAVVAGGRIACWGSNYSGQLGDGTTKDRATPVTVNGVVGAVAVAAGSGHSCALLADEPSAYPLGAAAQRTVQCWGENSSGQLGDGTTARRGSPVTVPGLAGATAVTAGSSHTCALLADEPPAYPLGAAAQRTVQCWGENSSGQLGDGTRTGSLSPVTVPGLTGVTSVVAAESQTCVILSGGGVQCWGMDETADGEPADRTSPVTVEGVTGATSIAVGERHACVVVAEGRVKCWGEISSGPWLRHRAVEVQGLVGATAVAAAEGHTCALMSSGGVQCWGSNGQGQLGDGTLQSRAALVTVIR